MSSTCLLYAHTLLLDPEVHHPAPPHLSLQVLMNDDGSTLDLVTALVAESHVLLLCSPGSSESVLGWISKNAVGGSGGSEEALKVSAADVSPRCVMMSLVGPEAETVLAELAGVSGDPQCLE